MTTVVATQPRRLFLLDQGEQLLVTRDALVAAERLTEFVEATGIASEHLCADPVTALPLRSRRCPSISSVLREKRRGGRQQRLR